MTDDLDVHATTAEVPVSSPPTGELPVYEAPPEEPTDEPVNDGRLESIVGGAMVVSVVLAALYFRHFPGPIFLDHWGFSFVHARLGNGFYNRVTDLRSVPVLVAGSILAALVVVGRDRLRAVACLVAPALAVVLVEWLLKPVVARRYAEVLSFPSGTTTTVAGLATAWVLAVPRRIRPVAIVIGAFLTGLECIAVVALLWHYPTDALAGAAFGAGVVFLVDGSLHLAVGAVRRRRAESGAPYAGVPGSATGTGAAPAPPPVT